MADPAIHVLIVDDDSGDRKQIRRMLVKSGLHCDLVEVGDMAEALTACDAMPFDVVLMDYDMPGLNGLGAITRMREQRPFLPIVMSTGQGCTQVAAEAIKLGALDYLPKSQIDEQTIRRVVESVIERARLNRKLAEQKEALENFANILAHDLRNPIATILGFTTLIEEELGKEHFDRQKAVQGLQRVSRATRTLQKMVDTLRQYTQLDAPVEFGPVAMQTVVEDGLSAMQQNLADRKAVIHFANLPQIRGNAPQLMQLMQNLVGNAVKYCDTSTPTVDIAAIKREAGDWLFEVRDNGIGFPAADVGRVFDAFKRLHPSSRYEGTGLGLAICKKIIERHGGSIWCASKEGLGTSFYFTLPEVQAQSDRPPGAFSLI